MFTLPRITTSKVLQKNYRQIFDEVKETKEPVVVMKNNKPDVVIVDPEKLEEMEAIIAVLQSREASRQGKAKELKGSLVDLWNETQEN